MVWLGKLKRGLLSGSSDKLRKGDSHADKRNKCSFDPPHFVIPVETVNAKVKSRSRSSSRGFKRHLCKDVQKFLSRSTFTCFLKLFYSFVCLKIVVT